MIETERLLLRKFRPDDSDWFVRMRGDAELMRYMGGAHPPEKALQRLHHFISFYDEHGFSVLAAIHKERRELIGWCGLHTLDSTPEIEVGYGFDKPYWGQGYATEAAAASLRYGFERAGLERIVAVAHPQNTGSWRVMEKLGMKFEKRTKHYDMDVVYYAISREDFRPLDSFYAVHDVEER
jgi:RimJ/RimL family protein N-acetyltransferase